MKNITPSSLSSKNTLAFALIISGVVLRVTLVPIASSYDLAIYNYFANAVLDGMNPYRMPVDGPINPIYADMPPFNFGLFAAALALWRDPMALKLLFIAFDTAAIFVVWCWQRSLAVTAILALNPVLLYWWFFQTEDKPVYFLAFVVLLYAIDRRRPWLALAACAFAAAYKFIGFLLVIPLIYGMFATWRERARAAVIFGVATGITFLPYFPDNLTALQGRAGRMLFAPIHESPFLLLSALGWYHPALAYLPAALTVLLFVGYFSHRLSLSVTITLILASNIFLPDIGIDRIIVLALPLLLIGIQHHHSVLSGSSPRRTAAVLNSTNWRSR